MSEINNSSQLSSNLTINYHEISFFRDLVERINVEKDDKLIENHCDEFLSNLSRSSLIKDLDHENHSLLSNLEKMAVSLWNIAVTRKTNGLIQPITNAKLRHVSTNLLFILNTHNSTISIKKRQLTMALKTSRAWLDISNGLKAKISLNMADECAEDLRKSLFSLQEGGGDNTLSESYRHEFEQSIFKIAYFKCEAAAALNEYNEAYLLFIKAKEFLFSLPNEANLMAVLAYNFAVECFHSKNYEICVNWLKESFDLGKGPTNPVSNKNQARTLRLLANAYLEWNTVNNIEKALNAVELANSEYSHPAGIYLKIRLLLKQTTFSEEELLLNFEDILKHDELTLELGLNIAQMVQHKISSESMTMFFTQLYERFKNTSENDKISLKRFEYLLELNETDLAAEFAEKVINDHHNIKEINENEKKRYNILFWRKGAECIEKNDFSTAIRWYNYSLAMFKFTEQIDQNLAKLHRNRCTCYLALDNLEKAKDSIEKAVKCDVNCPFNYYMHFRVALRLQNEQTASSSLKKMCDCIETNKNNSLYSADDPQKDPFTLTSLAAQLALEQSNKEIAVHALHNLIKYSTDTRQILTTARCLIRLKVISLDQVDINDKNNEMDHIQSYLATAFEKLKSLNSETIDTEMESEAIWFLKIAWNMGLQSKGSPHNVVRFFSLCKNFTELCKENLPNLIRRSTCVLMVSAASLQAAKCEEDKSKQKILFKKTLEYISEHDVIKNRIDLLQLHDQGCTSRENQTSSLLLLYEFEAKSNLGDQKLNVLMNKAISQPHLEPKIFETMAALSMQHPTQNKCLAIPLLKVAIRKYLQEEQINYEKCSKVFHSIIELCLNEGVVRYAANDIEEAWKYCKDVAELIQTKAKKDYPQMEIVWLMTKSWNCGIHLYSDGNLKEARKWCEMSMKFLENLDEDNKENYEPKIINVYGEILEKLDTSSTS